MGIFPLQCCKHKYNTKWQLNQWSGDWFDNEIQKKDSTLEKI